MDSLKRYGVILSLCLAVGLNMSCLKETSETVATACGRFWLPQGEMSFLKLDVKGNVYVYPFRYEEDADRYYVYLDSDTIYREYIIDAENSRICFLPDNWFDIYVLTPSIFTLGNKDGESIKMHFVPDSEITILSKKAFDDLYGE